MDPHGGNPTSVLLLHHLVSCVVDSFVHCSVLQLSIEIYRRASIVEPAEHACHWYKSFVVSIRISSTVENSICFSVHVLHFGVSSRNCVQIILEASMLLCEAVIFVCSILILKWDMEQPYQDMEVYTVMCSISTFTALAITLSFFIIPSHVRLLEQMHTLYTLYRVIHGPSHNLLQCTDLYSGYRMQLLVHVSCFVKQAVKAQVELWQSFVHWNMLNH